MRKLLQKVGSLTATQSTTSEWQFLEAIEYPVLILDSEGRIGRANLPARRLLRVNQEDIVGLHLGAIKPRHLWWKVAEQVRLTQETGHLISSELTDESSGTTWEFTITPLAGTGVTGQDGHALLMARDITEQKHVKEAFHRQGKYLEALHETTLELINRRDAKGLLEAIVARACAFMGVPNGGIYQVESSGSEMRMGVGTGVLCDLVGTRMRMDEGFAGRVWEAGRPLIVNDYSNWPHRVPDPYYDQFHAVVGVPLTSDSQVVGVLQVGCDKEGRQFGNEEVEVLTRFAQLASIALDNAYMHKVVGQELTRRTRAEEAHRDSEEKYKLLFQSNPLPLWVYDAETLCFLAVNDAATRHYGYSQEEFLAMKVDDLRPPGNTGALLLELAKGRPELTSAGTWKHRKKDGSTIAVEVTSHQILFGGRRAVLVLANDITERKRAEEALQNREEHFRSLIENAADLILILNTHGTVGYVSPSAERTLGYAPADLVCRNMFEFVHPEDFSPAFAALTRAAQSPGEATPIELRIRHKQGVWQVFEAIGKSIVDELGESSIIINARDITERKAAQEQLLHDALHDALTSLPNRVLFMDRLGQAILRTKRHEEHLFAVLFLDLDRFKLVNDSLGHGVGDELLVAMARRLESCLRPEDTIARLGGDEFAILLDGIEGVDAATYVAERIQKVVAAPFSLNGHPIYTTASIGIALSTVLYERPEDMLRDADTAMYRAKSEGKSCHAVFDKAMHARAVRLLQLQTDLWQALERNEFLLYYQPIVSLESSRVSGFEALVRWKHPTHGLVSPSEFIPLAEETRLIVPLGEWVLREACRQVRSWQTLYPEAQPLTISVNLSGKQLAQPDLTEKIKEILEETGLNGRSLKLEITESMIMEDPEHTADLLRQMKALDIQLQVDDFGTGYSSLSYLHKFPLDTLKIDRSFVSTMNTDGKNAEIVRTIVMLAHNLGMTVTAEGVETIEQLSQLSALRCEHGQGYFFSRPVDGEMAEALLSHQTKRYATPEPAPPAGILDHAGVVN